MKNRHFEKAMRLLEVVKILNEKAQEELALYRAELEYTPVINIESEELPASPAEVILVDMLPKHRVIKIRKRAKKAATPSFVVGTVDLSSLPTKVIPKVTPKDIKDVVFEDITTFEYLWKEVKKAWNFHCIDTGKEPGVSLDGIPASIIVSHMEFDNGMPMKAYGHTTYRIVVKDSKGNILWNNHIKIEYLHKDVVGFLKEMGIDNFYRNKVKNIQIVQKVIFTKD